MGTDSLGRDLLVRVLSGAHVSLVVGILTAAASGVLGILIGGFAGFFEGSVDEILMRITDSLAVFPTLLLAVILGQLFGNSFLSMIWLLSFTSWMNCARLVRACVLQVKKLPHIEAAVASGAKTQRLLFRHIVPHVCGPLIAMVALQIPTNILNEASLSFLGLGIQPPTASLGSLCSEGFRSIQSYPHLIIYPGTLLCLILFFFQLLGEWLTWLLDPLPDRKFY